MKVYLLLFFHLAVLVKRIRGLISSDFYYIAISSCLVIKNEPYSLFIILILRPVS